MISLRRTYKFARNRINQLRASAPPDEAFVLTMFFVEKIIRRTLLQLMIRSGMTLADAVVAMKKLKGIWAVKNAWHKYDPANRDLEAVIGKAHWDVIADSATKRNDLVHGSGNEGQRVYSQVLTPLIASLDQIRQTFTGEYKYAGWRGMKDAAGNPL
ncbi:MAG TPA: hypothetical protein DD381_10695 [Lentisphaeria bacterium]|nr:MAG: hypothetical protein A2X47_01980 [Lentisphaerae bacterium GWF2_38_69]HBM16795.1 hypothetical protein [Lentisphaeria bacterium]